MRCNQHREQEQSPPGEDEEEFAAEFAQNSSGGVDCFLRWQPPRWPFVLIDGGPGYRTADHV